jgi:hypothetical protein
MLVLLMGEFMHYAVEMDSGALISIPRFINTGFAIQKLIRRDTHTESNVIS